MRRSVCSIVGAVALAALLSACGDNSDDGGDASDVTECEPADATVQVGALDSLKFDAESYDATAGCIEIRYVNEGSVDHTLLVDGVDDFKLAVGDTDDGTLPLDTGTYRVYCDISGHEAAGMTAELVVS
ncbi:MAG: sulfocyanin-like copper-binding protein [Acidimicrobiales bacterium]